MSRGIGAYANKIFEDNETVIYEYGRYNLNAAEYRNDNHLCDGSITILKRCFAEPEIHQKLKKCRVVGKSWWQNGFQYQ